MKLKYIIRDDKILKFHRFLKDFGYPFQFLKKSPQRHGTERPVGLIPRPARDVLPWTERKTLRFLESSLERNGTARWVGPGGILLQFFRKCRFMKGTPRWNFKILSALNIINIIQIIDIIIQNWNVKWCNIVSKNDSKKFKK